jgi:hypothetical protein
MAAIAKLFTAARLAFAHWTTTDLYVKHVISLNLAVSIKFIFTNVIC